MKLADSLVPYLPRARASIIVMSALLPTLIALEPAHARALDPGVRGAPAGAGSPLNGLAADETVYFNDGLARFLEIAAVTGGKNNGLGPRFDSNQCFSCHSQPNAGGSSPASNPLIAVATLNGGNNAVPWFLTPAGPVREVRFKQHPDGAADGNVHNLFVISGRNDAVGCNIAQESFAPAG